MATVGGDADGETLRIVLLGKTGAGKSSLGNTLCGLRSPKESSSSKRDERPPERRTQPGIGFKVGKGLKSETAYSDFIRAEKSGIILEVTDTPGLCDTHLPEKHIYKEVAKSVALTKPGPNVIIFALRCDRRFTDEEYQAYQKLKKLFSDEMNRYLILVFNGLDTFDDDDEDTTIEEQRDTLASEIKKYGSPLVDMLKEASNRYMGMDNKKEKERQVCDLIKIMKELVKQNGQNACYSTKMSEQIMKKVEELVEEEAKSKRVDKGKALVEVKYDILSDVVKPTFRTSVVDVVATTAQTVTDGVSNMCAVM